MSSEEWALAKEVCTPKQLACLDWWRKGAGYKRIGRLVGVDSSTVRAHVKAGKVRIHDASDRAAA